MSPRLQTKLLRFLQDGGFRRVGSDEETFLDVRVICATQQNLPQLCSEGLFRLDLYHRLNVLSLQVPPLRECLDGIEDLATYVLDRAARQIGCPLPELSTAALEKITGYDWPGNVRQLENVLFQAVSLCEETAIQPAHLRLPQSEVSPALTGIPLEGSLSDMLGEVERNILKSPMAGELTVTICLRGVRKTQRQDPSPRHILLSVTISLQLHLSYVGSIAPNAM